MSQAQEVRCLNKEQIDTTLKNLCGIMSLTNLKKIFEGKPVFSKELEQKYKLAHITKFADNYTVYEAQHTGSDKYFMYFIILEATKFDKLNVTACSWFYHLFENNIDMHGHNGRPQVYISPAYVVTETMFLHIPMNILPCLYRFASLTEMYPMIGSKNGLYGLSYDYKIIPYEDLYNGRSYSLIFDSDVIVKILNAVVGDLICCKRILCEGSPYGEYYLRQVAATASDANIIDPSGICDGTKGIEGDASAVDTDEAAISETNSEAANE